MLPVMYKAPSNKDIVKIVMDIEDESSTKVVANIIEKPKQENIEIA